MINQLDNYIKINYATVAEVVTIMIYLGAVSNVQASDADYSFLIDSDWHNCQEISQNYQEVYAFETASFYVNICQKGNTYFYSGEAKQSDRNSIFIPATPLEDNRGFQANNGNVSYVVVLPFSEQNYLESSDTEPAEAILTIRRNERLVSVESSLDKYCHQSEAIAYTDIKLNSQNYNQLATVPQQQDVGWNLSSGKLKHTLPIEIFYSDSHFDFYRIDGKLHRLATCK